MSFLTDVRFALRGFRRRPTFAAIVIATLALGIGVNTAVFSVIDAVILHPLAVAHPNEFVAIYGQSTGLLYAPSSFATYREVAEHRSTFTAVSAFATTSLTFGTGNIDRELTTSLVTSNYFTNLGVHAALGRTFMPSDPVEIGANPTVVLSAALWRAQFGADRAIVGQEIRLNERPLTVIGVLPDQFHGTNLAAVPDVWVPVSMAPILNVSLLSKGTLLNEDVPLFSMIGHLGAGLTVERATADLSAGRRRPTELSGSAAAPTGFTVVPINEAAAAVSDRSTLFRFVRLLFFVVALTLLLACLNIANVLLVRASERAAEFGIRTALGASAGRLARQLIVESTLLSLAGGLGGLLLGYVTVRLLSSFTLPGGILIQRLDLGLDQRVLMFTFLLSLVTAVIFGLIPAVQSLRANVIEVLRQQGGQAAPVRGRAFSLAIQVAISLMLLVGAGLFMRSLQAGLSTNVGFDARPLAMLSARVKLDGLHAEVIRPFLDIVNEMTKTSGVTAAASTHVPLASTWLREFVAGSPSNPEGQSVMLPMESVTAEYFRVLGVPLVTGRFFDERDVKTAERVTILNESAARAFWPGESPLGRQITFSKALAYTVIGVVSDIKYTTLQDKGVPFAYAPLLQEDLHGRINFLVRSNNPQAALANLQRTASIIAPDLKGLRAGLVSDEINAVLMPQRFGAMLLSILALVALSISGVGIYGTVAYVVARRRMEIGIRLALGARRFDVLALVLRQSATAVGTGVVIGIVGAVSTTRLLAHFLYEVTALDWIAFAGSIVLVVVLSIAAAVVPSVRALRVDPVKAIRAS